MMQQYFFSAVVPAPVVSSKSGAQAPAVHAPDPASSMMQQYFFSAVVPAPVVQSWFSTVHVGVVVVADAQVVTSAGRTPPATSIIVDVMSAAWASASASVTPSSSTDPSTTKPVLSST